MVIAKTILTIRRSEVAELLGLVFGKSFHSSQVKMEKDKITVRHTGKLFEIGWRDWDRKEMLERLTGNTNLRVIEVEEKK